MDGKNNQAKKALESRPSKVPEKLCELPIDVLQMFWLKRA